MRFLIFLILHLMTMQVSLAGDAAETNSKDALILSSKDALILSAKLLNEKKYNQSLPISLAIYEQRKKDYVVAGILSLRGYFNTDNTKSAVFLGDEIKGVVQRDLVVGNESLSDWDTEMVNYFYWMFVHHYAGALFREKRYIDAIPYFRKLISHYEQTGVDTSIHIYSLASSCLNVGEFQCAENSYLQLLSAAKKNTEFEKYEKEIYYNLACAATGLGEYKKAKNYLLSTGWEWGKLEKLIADDNDLRGFRDSEYLKQLKTKIQDNK